ncbi:DUF2267 domain-containing protein [Psychromarinibacter sp. C21-152]|uniref:DUF2267 domain-containing protein n=1 Tax=Psychromarinibacter sediminicola TaxID=3033385 RepID=A0AAE3NW21_9RHOB|nr:DUF2267 domain-containing protein [Psychromarinibacter sediminicola]MDF0603177.1 DUF2267 domain-containing protein [Psychromarinibacter sediminicola]
MPMPHAYRTATRDWQAFLADARERLDLGSDNMAYTAVDGVLQTFRRRLTVAQGLAFADVLPAVLRAIFVYRWRPEAPADWGSRAEQVADAKAVRKDHNLTPDHCIEAVAWALRRHVRQRDLDDVLARIGPEAEAFWAVEGVDPKELERRFP